MIEDLSFPMKEKTKELEIKDSGGNVMGTFDWPASWPRILIPLDFVVWVGLLPLDAIAYLFSPPKKRKQTQHSNNSGYQIAY